MEYSKGWVRKSKRHEQKSKILEGNPLVVGIDLAKKRHAVVVSDKRGKPISRFMVEQSLEGMGELFRKVELSREGGGYDRVVYFMEPAGHYWMNVANQIEKRGETYRLISGLSVARQREISELTYAKSDYKDASIIGELGCSLNFTFAQLPSAPIWVKLRFYASEYQEVQSLAGAEKSRMKAMLSLVWPEYFLIYKGHSEKSSVAILRSLSEWSNSMGREGFLGMVRKHFVGKRFAVKKFKQVYDGLQKGSGYGVERFREVAFYRISMSAERLLCYMEQLERTKGLLLEAYSESGYIRYLDTIKGVSTVGNALVLAFMGDPAQYDDSSCIVKLAGMECRENSSGEYKGESDIARRGRAKLRWAATKATFSLLMHNKDFQRYQLWLMNRKENPLEFMQAFVACANKYLRIVYQLCKQKCSYDTTLVSPARKVEDPLQRYKELVEIKQLGEKLRQMKVEDDILLKV